jgi:hypothetical protein
MVTVKKEEVRSVALAMASKDRPHHYWILCRQAPAETKEQFLNTADGWYWVATDGYRIFYAKTDIASSVDLPGQVFELWEAETLRADTIEDGGVTTHRCRWVEDEEIMITRGGGCRLTTAQVFSPDFFSRAVGGYRPPTPAEVKEAPAFSEEVDGIALFVDEEVSAVRVVGAKPRTCLNRQYLLDALVHVKMGRGKKADYGFMIVGEHELDPVRLISSDGTRIACVMPIRR